jgi:hypothetical protein
MDRGLVAYESCSSHGCHGNSFWYFRFHHALSAFECFEEQSLGFGTRSAAYTYRKTTKFLNDRENEVLLERIFYNMKKKEGEKRQVHNL